MKILVAGYQHETNTFAPTLADCYLIPQLYSARRFNVDTTAWRSLTAIETHALAQPAFAAAHPDRQPDADA